jgi:outer membrane protein OmpU
MKKVLFATTALVATAGVASADIALSGSAEMGIFGGSDGAANGSNGETQFFQDLDVTFTMSGTADNGLTFGAAVDLDESDGSNCDLDGDDDTINTADDATSCAGASGAFAPEDDGGTTIFISGDFGTLTMGDTDGALDWALQEVNIGSPGSIDDSETLHAGYNGNSGLDGTYDGQVLRYDYSFGDFGFAVSAEADDDTITGTTGDGETGDPVWGLGATYDGMFAGGSFGVGIGYQTVNDTDPLAADNQGVDVFGISADVSLDNGLSVGVGYSMIDGTGTDSDEDGQHIGIGASYAFDAITVHANWGQYDWDDAATTADATGYGLAAAYDFGGGLSAHLGYGYSDVDGEDDENSWSFGLAMSF